MKQFFGSIYLTLSYGINFFCQSSHTRLQTAKSAINIDKLRIEKESKIVNSNEITLNVVNFCVLYFIL